MEQYFRIAIWMFCLVACLQAKPTPQPCKSKVPFDLDDLDFSSLDTISCGNVLFKTPTAEEWSQSRAESLELFVKELERVGNLTDCTGDKIYASLVAESVRRSTPKELKSDNSSEVQRENKKFEDFCMSFQDFLRKVNVDCVE